MQATRQPRSAFPYLLATLVVVVAVALGLPDRLLTRWAYAVEQGRIRAETEGLARSDADLVHLSEVSHAFRLVARIARPGVVHIHVKAEQDAHDRIVELSRERSRLDQRRAEIQAKIDNDTDAARDEKQLQELLRICTRLREIADELSKLADRASAASGSGIIFDTQGHILTNNHVVEGRKAISVQLADEREFDAVIIGADPKTDLAVIKIDAGGLSPLKFADSDSAQVGDWVLAVGAPFGLSQTVTHGIISATGRQDVAIGRGILYQNFLQTDAAINPGNSGGPLLNLRGEVLGVNTAIATDNSGHNAGVAFSIPSNLAVRIARQLTRNGEVVRGWLGITMGELSTADRGVLGIDKPRGVLVNAVLEGTPADKAGVQVGDVIVAINGEPIGTMAQLRGTIADIFPGETARLAIVRDGRRIELAVVLGRRPDDTALLARAQQRIGRPLAPLPLLGKTLLPTLADALGCDENVRGVIVVGFPDETSPVKEIAIGDIITAIDGQPSPTLAAARQVLASAAARGAVTLEIVNCQGDRKQVKINPARKGD